MGGLLAPLRLGWGKPAGNRQFRLAGGYDGVCAWLRAGLDPERVEVRLGTIVQEARWRDGQVAIDCRSRGQQTIRARAAVITIPIGVWKAPAEQEGAIRFDPPLEEKSRILDRLEVGHAVKLVFHFRERFWEALQEEKAAQRSMRCRDPFGMLSRIGSTCSISTRSSPGSSTCGRCSTSWTRRTRPDGRRSRRDSRRWLPSPGPRPTSGSPEISRLAIR